MGATSADAYVPPCERQFRAKPRTDVASGRAPLVIGDSVIWFAVEGLAERGFEADALGCRRFEHGVDMLARRKRQGRLPRLAVLALGSNWKVRTADIARARRVVGPRRTLALVTPHWKKGRPDRDAKRIRAAGRRHPNRVKVIDWVRYSRGRDWFSRDGIHPNRRGRDAYVRCVSQALPFAGRGAPPRRRHPCAPRH